MQEKKSLFITGKNVNWDRYIIFYITMFLMLIVVDKPMELSSFDVIRRLKHEFPGQKIWHSWTLDPKATWVMILWIGKWTKQLLTLIWLDKTYETVIDFSKMSDTWDLWYWDEFKEYTALENWKWIEKDWKEILAPSLDDIQNCLSSLIPLAQFPLPAFSAKKKDGQRMYDLARRGEIISETREMKINWFEILEYNFPIVRLRLDVWSWTYIRSIWYRLWQQFNLWGILTELRRLKVWEWNLREIKLDHECEYNFRWNKWIMKWWIIEE